jgi:peptidoglycan/xylan/chitin deacetylase (PgdA/CDA1 family)
MNGQLAILCYHRVMPDVARTGDGWPYFLRGTAVSVTTLARQIAQLARRFAIIDEAAVSAWARGQGELERPSVWITFDDGYNDILEHAMPALAGSHATASVFVTACTLATLPRALPADRWYAALARAQRRRGVLEVGGTRWAFDLDRAEDRARFVDGPERRRCLRARPAEQDSILGALCEALDASDVPAAGLYVSGEGLRQLVQRGWSVGAHGATHTPFPVLGSSELASEFNEMESIFARHSLPRPASLAYPDAAWSVEAEAVVAERGYRMGLLLGDQRAQRSPLRLCRFIVPDEPRWVEQVLLPALEVDG